MRMASARVVAILFCFDWVSLRKWCGLLGLWRGVLLGWEEAAARVQLFGGGGVGQVPKAPEGNL